MREHKFRMWNKKENKMYEVGQINFDDKRVFMKNYNMYTYSSYSFEDIELMEFTGLHDKNGKEIYEGDIIKAYDGRIQGEVVFDVRGLHFGIRMSDTENYTFSQNFLTSNNIEVIGNIYENRDLLKGVDNIE